MQSRRFFIMFATLAALISSLLVVTTSVPQVASAVEGDVLLSEDFEDGVADGFATSAGRWEVVDDGTGNLVYRGTFTGGSTSQLAVAGSSSWTDYTVEATVSNASVDNGIALRGRHTNRDNAYFLAVRTEDDELVLGRRAGGTSTTLDRFATPLDAGVSYRLKLGFEGNQLTGYLDDVAVLSATDTTFFAGKIAVGGFSKSSFSLDDVVVTDLRPVPEGDRYMTPAGAGAMDGSSWANAFPGDQPGGLQTAWQATGPTKTLHVGSGAYTTPQTLIMSSGGEGVTALKTLKGVDTGGGLPRFTGDWSLTHQVTRRLIEVPIGVSFWRVQDLVVENYHVGIMARGKHEGVRIDNFDMTNMSDGIYLWGLPRGVSEEPATASHDIVIMGGDYVNYTKSGVRFRNGNYLASVIDSRADAGGEANWTPGNFPLGFRVGTSGQATNVIEHDIVFQDVVSRNNYHDNGTKYWNADGFTAERRSSNITYVRTEAYDSTDGGYDVKSTNPAFIDAIAFGNKRNFRVWSKDHAQFFNVIGGYSVHPGGTGDSVGLWVGGGNAVADAYYSTFTNNAGSEVRLEDAVRVDVHDSIIAKTNGDSLYRVTGDGPLTVHNSEEFIAGVQGTDPQFVDGTNSGWEGGTDAFDSQVYGTTKGFHHSGSHDTPYTIDVDLTAVAVGVYEDVAVTATVTDANGDPVPDPEAIVWYSDAGEVARLLSSRGATAQVQGLTNGTTELVGIYKGEQVRVPVTVGGRFSVSCNQTIASTHEGKLDVDEGVVCLVEGAQVLGPVTVWPGAGLVARDAVIKGTVDATGASTVLLLDSEVTGSVTVRGTSDQLAIVDTSLIGPLTLTDNNTGAEPIVVSGNDLTGRLACSGNESVLVNAGVPNSVTGARAGQCVDLPEAVPVDGSLTPAGDLVPGEATMVELSVTNLPAGFSGTLQDVAVALDVPAGWDATVIGPTTADELVPGETLTGVWELVAPVGTEPGTVVLTGTASYADPNSEGRLVLPTSGQATVLEHVVEATALDLPQPMFAGRENAVAVTIVNNSHESVEVTATVEAPAGWTAHTVTQTLATKSTVSVTVPVTPPGGLPSPGLAGTTLTTSLATGDPNQPIGELEAEAFVTAHADDIVLALDGGTANSPVLASYTRLADTDQWDPAAGYGWVTTNQGSRDRGAPDPLRSDFILGPPDTTGAVLRLHIPAGEHTISLLRGDNDFAPRDDAGHLKVEVDGEVVVPPGDPFDAGEYIWEQFTLNGGPDGRNVDLRLSNENAALWRLNALLIQPTN